MKMRICRTALVRVLFLRNAPKWRIILQLIFLLSAVLFLILYLIEKSEKEKLISGALGNARVDEMVRPENDTLLLNGMLSGSGQKSDKNPFIVIGVTSLPRNIGRRDIIRSTWAKDAYKNYGAFVIFFLGKPSSPIEMAELIAEAEQHEDIIVDDFQESYYALSIKTLRLLKYFKFYHSKSKFLVKTDDDVFINVHNLVHYCFLQNHEFEAKFQQPQEEYVIGEKALEMGNNADSLFPEPFHFIGGVIHSDRGPHTWDAFSKWYAPSSVWKPVYDYVIQARASANGGDSVEKPKSSTAEVSIKDSEYPPYAEGNFYILSDDAVFSILGVSRKVPLYHLEDVFVTGVLATWLLGIEKVEMAGVSSSSNWFPTWSYWYYSKFIPPEELIVFHCDNNIQLIEQIHKEYIRRSGIKG